MKTQDYTSTITVNVSPQEAFEAISRITGWWVTKVEGESLAVGDVFTLPMNNTWVKLKVAEAVPGRRIVWDVVDSYLAWVEDKSEWTGTKIVWDITSDGAATTITMTHVGLMPEVECYDVCQAGWTHHVQESLKSLLTEGKGNPRTFDADKSVTSG